MSLITDRTVLTEKKIINCLEYGNKTPPLSVSYKEDVLFTCGSGVVLKTTTNSQPVILGHGEHITKIVVNVWAICTMSDDLYNPVNSKFVGNLEQSGIQRVDVNSNKVDVVFAMLTPSFTMNDTESMSHTLIPWCLEACRSGINVLKALFELANNNEKNEIHAKTVLADRDLKLRNLMLSMGLSSNFKWNGCPRSWYSIINEKQIISKIIQQC